MSIDAATIDELRAAFDAYRSSERAQEVATDLFLAAEKRLATALNKLAATGETPTTFTFTMPDGSVTLVTQRPDGNYTVKDVVAGTIDLRPTA